jgi:hypothetical protein
MDRSDLPQITINYSPKLDLRIQCVRAERYRHVGHVEHRFEVKCRLRHPSGTFEYFVADLCFDLDSFSRFEEDLRGIQRGEGNRASLRNVGDMMVLSLAGSPRHFQAELKIREYMAPHITTLTSTLDVDYDLFVNKLATEMQRFASDLRLVQPDEVG